MRKLTFILSAIAATLWMSCAEQTIEKNETVNPILSDISFISKFGYAPDEKTNDNLRIQTHLEYVENLLRQKEVAGLSPELQLKRNQLLDLLHNYWVAGVFPRNYDYSHRQPCFIDKDNRICAVGYLVEQTAGRQFAEAINSRHQYNEIKDMNDKRVEHWIAGSGLSKEEFAMIQPTYQPYSFIEPAYGISTAILSGLNVSLSTINGIQIANESSNKVVPVVGIISGSGQLITGLAKFNTDDDSGFGSDINESENAISMVNIGIGTTTMILSTWNLIAGKKSKEQLTSWNIYGVPTGNKSLGMGFSLSRRF
ncbi:MAG: hypothetical protein ABIO46_06700 [Chitinophagales bacterium]